MARSLEALKNAFSQKASGGGDPTWKKFFQFWKADFDTVSTLRFLPDLDEENNLGFLVENLQHELIVNGERKKLPCMEMYGEACPICELSRKYYNEKNDAMGKKYYRKKSYIGQVLILDTPVEFEGEGAKLIEFGPKIFKQIQASFQSGDLENAPYELKGGYNFRIKKTKSGEYADYGTSSFSPKQSDIDDSVIGSLDLYDLKEYRTKYVDVNTINAILIAEQTGASFTEPAAPISVPVAATVVAEPTPQTIVSAPALATATVEPVTEAAPTGKTSEILDRLRARAKAKQAE